MIFYLLFWLSILKVRRVGFWLLFCMSYYWLPDCLVWVFCWLLDYKLLLMDWGVLIFLPFKIAWFLMLTILADSDDERLEFIWSCFPILIGVTSLLTDALTLLPPPLELSLSLLFLFMLLSSFLSLFSLWISMFIYSPICFYLTIASWYFILYVIICFLDSSLKVNKSLKYLSIFVSLNSFTLLWKWLSLMFFNMRRTKFELL